MLGVCLIVDDVRKGPKLTFSYPLTLHAALAAAHSAANLQHGLGSGIPVPAAPLSTSDAISSAADYFAKLLRPKPHLCNRPFTLRVADIVLVSYPVSLPQSSSPAPSAPPAASLPPPMPSDDSFFDDGIDSNSLWPSGVTDAAPASSITMFNVVFIVDGRYDAPRDRSPRSSAPHAPASSVEGGASPVAAEQRHVVNGPVKVSTGDEAELDAFQLHNALVRGLTDVAQRLAACLLYEEGRCGYVSRQAQLMLLPPAGSLSLRASPSTGLTATGSASSGGVGTPSGTVISLVPVPASHTQLLHSARSQSADAFAVQMTSHSAPAALPPVPSMLSASHADSSAVGSEEAVLAAFPELRFALAWELAYLYHQLRGGLGSVCHMRINNWLTVSLSLSPHLLAAISTPFISSYGDDKPLLPAAAQDVIVANSSGLTRVPSTLGSPGLAPSAAEYGASGERAPVTSPVRVSHVGGIKLEEKSRTRGGEAFPHMMPIRAYHTLLLLEETDIILSSLPPDSSPQLAQLVVAAAPLMSFHQLQSETGIPSSQLLRLAAHLVHWGLAIIINVITHHSVYTVSPSADLSPRSPLVQEFNTAFAAGASRPDGKHVEEGFTLASILALFSFTHQIDVGHASGAAAPLGSTVGGGSVSRSSAGGGASRAATSQPPPARPGSSSVPVPTRTGEVANRYMPARVASPSAPRSRMLPDSWVKQMRGTPTTAASVDVTKSATSDGHANGLPQRGEASRTPAAPPSIDPDDAVLRTSINDLRQLPRLRIGCGLPLRTLMSAMPKPRATQFITALTWLLKHGFLRQMHTYVYLVWPWPLVSALVRNATTERQLDKDGAKKGDDTSSFSFGSAMEPVAVWTDDERRYVRHLVRGKQAPLAEAFVRVLVYVRDTMCAFGPPLDDDPLTQASGLTSAQDVAAFRGDLLDVDGMHPILKLGLRLEEIMWRLKMTRSDLQTVLAAFPEVLVTSIHE